MIENPIGNKTTYRSSVEDDKPAKCLDKHTSQCEQLF